MARYHLVEKNNMQLYPEDHPLTPRVELWEEGEWFTQIYDLTAKVSATDQDGVIVFQVSAQLLNEARKPSRDKVDCSLVYQFNAETLTITASAAGASMVLPVISTDGEKVIHTANRIEIHKPQCKVVIETNASLATRPHIFNLVPGFQAVPVIAEIPSDGKLECLIRVMSL
jgi:hypothetical protein